MILIIFFIMHVNIFKVEIFSMILKNEKISLSLLLLLLRLFVNNIRYQYAALFKTMKYYY